MVNEKRSTLVSRRRALAGVAALGFGLRGSTARADVPGLKIGVPDWTLKHSADIGSFALARKIGFAGVEVSVNRAPSKSGRVEAFDDALCQRYIAESKKQGVAIASTRINGFSRNLEPETAVKFLVEGSRATQRLGVHVMLVPCFGLKTDQEMDRMGDILRQAGPEAEKAGAILALEDSNTARENVRMIERSRSSAVKVFYDIGNTTRYGYDIFEEIRWLGTDRICQFHLKDYPATHLGDGKVNFRKFFTMIAEMGYRGWADVEMRSPNSVEQDLRQDLEFVLRLLGRA